MADQSIALQAKAPDIDVMAPLLAFQRLQMGEESLLQNRQARQNQGNENDAQLMRQAIAEAGDDPEAWAAAMDKAAQRGSTTAAQNRQYSPLAAQRLQRAYGGGGPLMRGGQAQEGGQGGGMGHAPDISQDQGFIQRWGKLQPPERANLLRGFARAAQLLPQVRDQASMDRMVDTLKAEGHPEAENLRGQYSPMAVQSLHNRIQQMMQFGGEQGARGMTGAEYTAPTEDLKVGEDIVQHDLGTGGYTQKYHAQPTTADDWLFIGTDENGKPISQNRRSGEYKTGDMKISAKPGVARPGRATEIRDMLIKAGYSEADATAMAAGRSGMTRQKALETGMRIATRGEFLSGAAADARAEAIASDLMEAAPVAPPVPSAATPAPTAAPRQPTTVPNQVAPARPAVAPQASTAPTAGAIQHLKDNPTLAPMFDQKYGPGASRKYLPAVGPQSSLEQSRTGQGGPENAIDMTSAVRQPPIRGSDRPVTFAPGIATPVEEFNQLPADKQAMLRDAVATDPRGVLGDNAPVLPPERQRSMSEDEFAPRPATMPEERYARGSMPIEGDTRRVVSAAPTRDSAAINTAERTAPLAPRNLAAMRSNPYFTAKGPSGKSLLDIERQRGTDQAQALRDWAVSPIAQQAMRDQRSAEQTRALIASILEKTGMRGIMDFLNDPDALAALTVGTPGRGAGRVQTRR